MKRSQRQKVPAKNSNKQLKISSFFSVGKNGSPPNSSTHDNKQTKISQYFCNSKPPINVNNVQSSVKNGLNTNGTSHTSNGQGVLRILIDLTDDDEIKNNSTALSVKNCLDFSPSKYQNGSSLKTKVKLSEKENSPIKNSDEPLHVNSPDVVLPTPPKFKKSHRSSIKRKFDFSDFLSNKDGKIDTVLTKPLKEDNLEKTDVSKPNENNLKQDNEEKYSDEECDNKKRIKLGSDGILVNKNNDDFIVKTCKNDNAFKNMDNHCTTENNLCKNVEDSTKICANNRSNLDLETNKKLFPDIEVNNKSECVLNNQCTEKNVDFGVFKNVNNHLDNEMVCKQTVLNSNADTSETEFKSVADNKLNETNVNDVNSHSNNDEILIEDWNLDDFFSTLNRDVNLDIFTKCKVLSVRYKDCGRQMEVCVEDCIDLKKTYCTLQGSWVGLHLKESDIISVMAEWNDQLGWTVTDTAGYIVLEPDILVAGTTLVGSLFCMRRGILSDMFRGLDPNSEIMIIGSLLHELLQEVLKNKLRTKAEIENLVDKLLTTKDFIFTLYSSDVSMDKVRKQLDVFVPEIIKFIANYIPPVIRSNSGDCWRGEITSIEDIEENIWATNLGLKGKIDVTVKVKTNNNTKIMPLELKTGRASFSSEHRGQVILYTLMMTELGKHVDSGLLLYLREGVMKEVKAGVMEKRDLILLRNEFIRHSNDRKDIGDERIINNMIGPPDLPEPINHLRGCSTCPYLTICSAAIKESGVEKLPEKNSLHELLVPATEHLKSEHLRFVFHWVGLLQLEEKEIKRNIRSVKDIWNLKPEEREKNGNCICNLNLSGDDKVTEESNGHYKHTFIRDEEFTAGVLTKGDYLTVSTDKRIAIASGFISELSTCSCTIMLERDLSIHKNMKFHLDHYESQNSLIFNMTNLGHLLEATPQTGWLRDKIISMELPVYSRLSSEVLSVGQDVLSKLNRGQKHAVLQALASQHYLLIKGMPGTGKTATLVSLIKLLVRLGQSVLITSHTHSAVDNVIQKLPNDISILRLGPLSKVHPDVQAFSEHHLIASATTPEQLELDFNSKQVVGVTCLGSGHPLLRRRKFDVVVVDEATQVLLPTTLRPLFAASKFILVGDPMQLPPLVKSKRASELGLRQSLFSHLDIPAVTAVLSSQYRMNQCINDLANSLTYEGKLECANETISQATINIKTIASDEEMPEWMNLTLSTSLDNSVIVLDSGFVNEAKYSNKREVEFVVQIVNTFLKCGLNESQIGIIAPFQAQVLLIRNRFSSDNTNVEVSTVDTYQGRDKDVIVYSCTRSSHATELGLLSDHNRLTVAITRAKHKLVFIGDVQTLKSYSVFQKLFKLISPSCFFKLPTDT